MLVDDTEENAIAYKRTGIADKFLKQNALVQFPVRCRVSVSSKVVNEMLISAAQL